MFSPTSRYAAVATTTLTVTAPDGSSRTITYARRRLLPPLADQTQVAEHTMGVGERLDHVARRYLGDPTLYWRICDATDVMRPADLEQPGRQVSISLHLPPGSGGS